MPTNTLHITNAWHRASGGISAFYRALLNAAAQTERKLTLVVPAERDGVETIGAACCIYHVAAPHTPFFDRRYRLLLPHTYLPPRIKPSSAIKCACSNATLPSSVFMRPKPARG